MGFDLVWRGLQLVHAHHFRHHQAHAHPAFGLRAEHVFGNRGFVGVFDAALFQLFTRTFTHAVKFRLHDGLGQIEFGLSHQGVQGRLLVATQQTEFDFALEVVADVGAQAGDGGIRHAQRLAQLFGEFGQVGCLELFQGDHEIGGFASHIPALVVVGEFQREGFAFARLHAAGGVFEFFQHLAFADDELEVFGTTAIKRFAINLA